MARRAASLWLLLGAAAGAADWTAPPRLAEWDELAVDARGHLAAHWLLVADGCAPWLEELGRDAGDTPLWRRAALVAPGGALARDLELELDDGGGAACAAACLELGTPRALARAPPHVARAPRRGAARLRDFLGERCETAEMGFVSHWPTPLSLLWVAPSRAPLAADDGDDAARGARARRGCGADASDARRRVPAGVVAPGEAGVVWQTTRLGHVL